MPEQVVAKEHAVFFTATCLEWKHLLADDNVKDIVIDSLRFFSKDNRMRIFAFASCLIIYISFWQMLGNHIAENVQRDFLKYTGQRIPNYLLDSNSLNLAQVFRPCDGMRVTCAEYITALQRNQYLEYCLKARCPPSLPDEPQVQDPRSKQALLCHLHSHPMARRIHATRVPRHISGEH